MVISQVIASFLFSASCALSQPIPGQAIYTVAVVDKFYPGNDAFESVEERNSQGWLYGVVDLDRDRVREPYYHGDIVSLLVSHPQISVAPYPIRSGFLPLEEILYNLNEVRKHVFWGEPISAVLLSWESSTLISAFEKPLNKLHVKDYKAKIREWGQTDKTWFLTYQIIRAMEDLAEVGVLVYTIAGNGGRGMVNTYSFADGVITVGAVEKELDHFVANNTFVDTHERAAYFIRLVVDSAGEPLGYDMDGDGLTDIPIKCLSGYTPERSDYPTSYWRSIIGSSYAAPRALRKSLLKNVNHPQTHIH